MPVLYLHAGFHKTGTSSIQRAAARNRRALKRAGLLYPALRPFILRPVNGHHFLAHAIAGQERFLNSVQVTDLLERWKRKAQACGCPVLLSSEAFCRHRLNVTGDDELQAQERYLRRLAVELADFEVEPVLVIRRQDDYVRSLYQEHVASGLGVSARMSFSTFLCDVAASKPRFLDRLRLFKSVFGQVRVLVYEELLKGGLLSGFFSSIGVDFQFAEESQRIRQSLNVSDTLVKARLNSWVKTRRQNYRLLRWLGSSGARKIMTDELGGVTTLWPSRDARSTLMASFAVENELIGQEFFGQAASPFPPPGPPKEDARFVSPGDIERTLSMLAKKCSRTMTRILGEGAVVQLQQNE